MTAREVFRDSTGAIRPPWRLAIFVAATVISLIVVDGAVVPFVSSAIALTGVRVVIYPWMLLLSAVIAHVFTFHVVEPRRWRSVRLDREALKASPIVLGTVLGALAVGIPSLVLLGLGWLDIVPGPVGSSLAAALSIALYLAPAALWEEMVFRGYGFTVLVEWWGAPAALGVSSLLFGLVHFQNANASLPSVLVVVLAGVFLGGVLLATKSLYAAFAAHLAWNWVLAGGLHSAVSGIPFATPDYRVVDAGPDWATGGLWGPEGGIPAALGLCAATTYLYARQRRREEP